MAAPKTALRASGLLVAVITAALGIIAGPVRAEELDRELVLGDWIDDNGLQWSIAVEEPSGVIPTAAQPPAQKSSAAIEAKQKEVDALKTDTRHYWKNVDTGEILKQPRNQPRNPGLPYFYMGEAPNDAEKVKALTDEIAALQSASGGVPQPPPFRNPGNGLPATVSVKLAGSHMVVFKEGWYDGNSVQARRRITDPADVPADVAIEKTRSEIASKWQPWQWLDFKVIRDPSSGTRLAGNFWSSPFIATEDGTVTRIDPAEATTFNLARKRQGFIYITNAEPPHQPTDMLATGDRFRVGVVLDWDPGLPTIEITIHANDPSRALVRPAHRVDATTYMTDPIRIEPTVEP